MNQNYKNDEEKKENHLKVSVQTTSGSWPAEGYEIIPIHQKVKIALQKAAEFIHIVPTNKWIAKVGGRELNPDLSFQDNNLVDTITIDYGPSETGGGNE